MTTTPERTATLTSLVAAEVRAWMGRLDVRQSELARRMGETDQWMSMRLKGRTPIDLNELQRIADALDVPLIQLLPLATHSDSRDLNPRLSRPGRKDDPKPVRDVAPRRFGQPRRDPNGPPSATPLSSRRPRDTRPVKRPMAVAS
jgi:transcriptional regulator with XRE-family HTH domain